MARPFSGSSSTILRNSAAAVSYFLAKNSFSARLSAALFAVTLVATGGEADVLVAGVSVPVAAGSV